MFPSEIIILLSMASTGGHGLTFKATFNVMGEYIEYLYNSLVRRGFLEKSGQTKYKLTPIGEVELINFLDENRSRALDVMKSLQRLSIESVHKIDDLSLERVR